MGDATLGDYSELAAAVIVDEYPILPRPEWGQNAAFIAFVLDKQHEQLLDYHAMMRALVLVDPVRRGVMSRHGTFFGDECTFCKGRNDPYRAMKLQHDDTCAWLRARIALQAAVPPEGVEPSTSPS